jgi:hypothetical protein
MGKRAHSRTLILIKKMSQTKYIRLITKINFAVVGGLLVCASAQAQDVTDQAQIKIAREEIVIPGVTAQESSKKIKDALSSFATPANVSYNGAPDNPPVLPDSPRTINRVIRGIPITEYRCDNAYAKIQKKPAGVNNSFYRDNQLIQACVYPFQKGVKVDLIFTTVRRTESLTSGLFNGITHAIRGQDEDWLAGQLKDLTDSIRKELPSLLVGRIDIPGAPPQQPDKEAVDALIPPAAVAAAAQAQSMPMAPMGMPMATPVAAPATPSDTRIDARKNLVAMGLQYFSQDQFIAAIKRKDDTAVKLFLDGGGIDPAARSRDGKTPADIANQVGATDIAQMIMAAIAAPKQTSSSTSDAVQGAPVPPAPTPAPQAFDLTSMNSLLDKAEAQLSSEDQARISQQLAQVEGMPQLQALAQASPPAAAKQLAQLRWQLLVVNPASRTMAQIIDPKTGRLIGQ